jgi:N-methylhydantoinase A/oxoprolinase/acetone carboxylase beta subunit
LRASHPVINRDTMPSSITRGVFFAGVQRATRVYQRAQLRPGDEMDGPAIIEEPSCTTLIPPGYRATVDAFENLVVMP